MLKVYNLLGVMRIANNSHTHSALQELLLGGEVGERTNSHSSSSLLPFSLVRRIFDSLESSLNFSLRSIFISPSAPTKPKNRREENYNRPSRLLLPGTTTTRRHKTPKKKSSQGRRTGFKVGPLYHFHNDSQIERGGGVRISGRE